MHVIFRESHGLEEADAPRDLGQPPADLVVLSFSDSDLGAFAEGWRAAVAEGEAPSLRLANLALLRHPLSVDAYVQNTLSGAKAILIRLIGGAAYWAYGLEQIEPLARAKGIALAVLPADGREDARLDAASTLAVPVLRRLSALCEAGGEAAARAALAELAGAAGLRLEAGGGETSLPQFGFWRPETGWIREASLDGRPLILLSFYRSWLAAADVEPMARLCEAFEARGFQALGAFVPSLKEPEAALWLRESLARLKPAAIVNATAFSARAEGGSPLDAAGVPVFQAILATNSRRDWLEADRGLSPADLAMHVALPEVDGRIPAGVVSFKEAEAFDADLHFARSRHAADPERVAALAERVAGWRRMAAAQPRKLALILSTYPGKAHQMAHAVGLDALASAEAMLEDLGAPEGPPLAEALQEEALAWPLADYAEALRSLPEKLRADLQAAWGEPEEDPAFREGAFHFKALRRGDLLVALQPERGAQAEREAEYHDLARVPRHGYVAFYLWLRRAEAIHALIHIGAHGTLEWLPGKSAALSAECWPEALIGSTPVLYPFVVNDPGEAAQARRRLGAATLGHLPPPLAQADSPPALARLERLLDEYSTADGLDPARRKRLVGAIRAEAQGAGVEADLGLSAQASPAEAVTRIDRFVCDLKESRFVEGLHVWGRGTPDGRGGYSGDPASIASERAALGRALAGMRIPAGLSGSPYRGRSEVLPTGRNLYATDPRATPSRAAHAQGVKLAEELLRRHLQDHGDWPRGLVVDLWGSATMRTAGEDFAMALHLAGAAPLWDEGSDRVTGFEIIPLPLLDRPRIEVSLRVSGLFRDVFPELAGLFEAAAAALAAREEAPDFNPYVAAAPGPRVFAPAPGSYGLALDAEDYSPEGRARAGEAWLAASSHSAAGEPAREALEARLRGAEAFVHTQDLPETDLLLAMDYAAHEGGFAAAMARLGAPEPALWRLDSTRPDQPRAHALPEEIARVVRIRAANPIWLTSMTRHGFRGAAEIAATLDHLAAFAHLTRKVPPHLFDLYHEATLGNPEICDFLARANPAALAAMEARFEALRAAGLWISRSNSLAAGVR